MNLNNRQITALVNKAISEIQDSNKKKLEEYKNSKELDIEVKTSKQYKMCREIFSNFPEITYVVLKTDNNSSGISYYSHSYEEGIRNRLIYSKNLSIVPNQSKMIDEVVLMTASEDIDIATIINKLKELYS